MICSTRERLEDAVSKLLKHNYCKFCAEDLSTLPLHANLMPHRIGLCTPTHNEVEAALRGLEIDDEREKEAIRKFWERERERSRAIRLRWNWLTGILAFLCIAAAGYLAVILWLSL